MPGMIVVVIGSENRCAVKSGCLSLWPSARASALYENFAWLEDRQVRG